MNTFTISAYSTALFATWYFIEEAGVLFDCGDGVTAHLLHKSRKIKYVFLSHADRDHITGLLQLNQLNVREGFPKIYYPQSSHFFPAMQQFFQKFDPHAKGAEWQGIKEGDEIAVGKDLVVKAFRNEHVAAAAGVHKSLSCQLVRLKEKLRPEYLQLTGRKIAALKKSVAPAQLVYGQQDILLGYSGDTPMYRDGRWNNSGLLIHEATFLYNAEIDSADERGDRHSTLEDVIAMAAGLQLKGLVLFSPRYHTPQIREAILALCSRHNISFPVYAIMPGDYLKDVLAHRII